MVEKISESLPMLKKYRDEHTIRNIILDIAQKKGQVVYGQQSVNVQLPKHLQRKTKDYDIYTSKPKESAEELVDKLNREYGKNKFKVIEGKHKGTFKVKDDKETIADYTRVTRHPKSNKILGIAYANLKYQKGKLGKVIKNKDLEYRHEKDKDTLSRIKQSEMRSFFLE